MRPEVFHQILERAKAARDSGIRPAPWVQDLFDLSRQQVSRYLADLCARGLLHRHGIGRGVYYTYSVNRRLLFGSTIDLASPPERLALDAEFAVSAAWLEALFANAARHSGGRSFRFALVEEDGRWILEAADDGVGIFQHVMEHFRCNSRAEAAGELLKGARVVAPDAGLSLAALLWAVDFAMVEANGLKLTIVGRSRDWSLQHLTAPRAGTIVTLELEPRAAPSRMPPDSPRGGRVLLPVQLFAPAGRLADRRDAKRMLRAVAEESFVVLDFRRVDAVQASFLDQILVVFKSSHPRCSILPINLSPSLRTMLNLMERKR